MARIARQGSTSGFYHIMARGINRENIFAGDTDKKVISGIISGKIEESDVDIYAYCIMNNHIHLLLRTELDELSAFMKRVNGSYALYYNKERDRIGPVFQGRFKSERVENDAYFWGVLRYIHLNPVKAFIVQRAIDYPWSSMREFITGKSKMISEEAMSMKSEIFKDAESFLHMHTLDDLQIYLDADDDMSQSKKAVAEKMLKLCFHRNNVNNIAELKEKGEEFEGLLRKMRDDLKLSYPEIAKLTGLPYTSVRRIICL